MNTIIPFIIVLGLLIFVHEFGHFLWAKIFKVKVLKFSLGFGPTLFGRKYGETEYVVSAFPLGGYVKMLGESQEALAEDVSPEEASRAFAGKPVWQRFIIVAGGPVFNLVFAVFLFFIVFAVMGLPQPVESTKIGMVNENSPASIAGLQAGDVILAVDDRETLSFADVAAAIGDSGGQPATLHIRRGDEEMEVTVAATLEKKRNIFGEEVGERYMIGISRTDEVEYEKVSLGRALVAGLSQTWGFIYLTIMAIVKMIQKVIPASELGGPILIAQMAGRQMEAGWINFFYFMGLLSVNLGVLNLLPIPILDGGHLVFFTVEAVQRKPLSMQTMDMLQQVGLVLLGTLMVFVFYNDIIRLFG